MTTGSEMADVGFQVRHVDGTVVDILDEIHWKALAIAEANRVGHEMHVFKMHVDRGSTLVYRVWPGSRFEHVGPPLNETGTDDVDRWRTWAQRLANPVRVHSPEVAAVLAILRNERPRARDRERAWNEMILGGLVPADWADPNPLRVFVGDAALRNADRGPRHDRVPSIRLMRRLLELGPATIRTIEALVGEIQGAMEAFPWAPQSAPPVPVDEHHGLVVRWQVGSFLDALHDRVEPSTIEPGYVDIDVAIRSALHQAAQPRGHGPTTPAPRQSELSWSGARRSLEAVVNELHLRDAEHPHAQFRLTSRIGACLLLDSFRAGDFGVTASEACMHGFPNGKVASIGALFYCALLDLCGLGVVPLGLRHDRITLMVPEGRPPWVSRDPAGGPPPPTSSVIHSSPRRAVRTSA